MADAAGAITNGFRLAGFTGIRGMCWFHVTKALKSRLAKINDELSAKIRSDIHFLQLSQTPAIFDSASKLFASIMPLSGVGVTPWTDAYNWKRC